VNAFKVLFVDDEVDYLDTLVKRMRKRGLDVQGVSSGAEALAALDHQTPDVVVLDVRMPGMDGIEILRRIKQQHPLVEVLMLTGHACLEAAREGMQLGAFDYLMKPINIDELLYKLQDAYQKKAIQEAKIKKMEEVMTSCNLTE